MTTRAVVMWQKRKNLFFVFLVELGVFLFEFFDSTSSIDQFLFAGEEGMTGGTDFDLHFTVDRSEFKLVAAGTDSIYLMVFWMDIRFHFVCLQIYSSLLGNAVYKRMKYNSVSSFFNKKNESTDS